MNTMNQAINGVKSAAHSAASDAENFAGAAKEKLSSVVDSAEHVAKGARSNWLSVMKAVTGAVVMLRSFGAVEALGLLGLRRQGSPLMRAGTFGVGLSLGLGAGILLAPASGKETRRQIRSRLAAMAHSAKAVFERAEVGVKDAAKNGVKEAEVMVAAAQDMVSEG